MSNKVHCRTAGNNSIDSTEQLSALREAMTHLRDDLLALEEEAGAQLEGLDSSALDSARNLLHYLALRRHDLRELQPKLAAVGLSSLGRAESGVLATLDAVLTILNQVTAQSFSPPTAVFHGGADLLAARSTQLLGAKPVHRAVRIMVTMPSEAADNPRLIHDLLAAGMDCLRINCAHDDAAAWERMIAHLRQAESELGRSCRVLMDLAGPKLRTGPVEPGPRVVKWRPRRDAHGRVVASARIWLTASDRPTEPPGPADACLQVAPGWVESLTPGERIKFKDARKSSRRMTVVESAEGGWWAEARKTAYVVPGTVLRMTRGARRLRREGQPCKTRVGDLPSRPGTLVLYRGDLLILTRALSPGRPAVVKDGRVRAPATIGCTLPEVFRDVRPGEPIWLDDGKIGGVVRQAAEDRLLIEITHARPDGEKLAADKGINLPESQLRLPALTEDDRDNLPFVAAHADLVGLSFVHEAEDVTGLAEQLRTLAGEKAPGIVLKIETQRAFENLPQLLLAALRAPSAGVMIARGDLAVECGFERLAELQEEILWLCEAAHLPVIWATQVLEHLAKEGRPSRAEITDAAMGVRAECVMLNKGPHILEAVRALDDILHRMQAHQSKKRTMLRSLRLADRFDPSES
jgi:pyruvate kinase